MQKSDINYNDISQEMEIFIIQILLTNLYHLVMELMNQKVKISVKFHIMITI